MSKSRENFVRLAENRTNKVLKQIDLLSNLSNKTNYAYTDEDIQKIFSAINKRVKDSEKKFQLALQPERKDNFKL